ncbi:MAG TPA: hypothetical protein VGO67_03035 [Verrucomicrobiae bacterium]|jgi:uncharacterized coiled-coil DUF342 family protein
MLQMVALSDPSIFRQVLEELRGQPDQLVEIILRQAGMIEELRQDIEKLKEQIKDFNDRTDGLGAKVERLAKAAPFRIDDKHRVAERKKPGRAPRPFGLCPRHS